MAGVDCLQLQAMIFLAFLLLGAVHAHNPSMAGEELVPVQTVEYRTMAPGRPPYETCGACRCCSKSNSSNCVQTRCCFFIKCDIPPGKPYSVCAFTPRNCDCGINNCGQRPPLEHLVV